MYMKYLLNWLFGSYFVLFFFFVLNGKKRFYVSKMFNRCTEF